MPQIFQVLRCYKCSVFQVHQTKKSNKFVCKLCGEKQSIKRHYGIGIAKDCRLHVQKLNGLRKDIDELNNTISSSEEESETPPETEKQTLTESKWSTYVENTEIKDTEETMYLDNKEVVLEVPKKRFCREKHERNINDKVSKSTDIPILEVNRSSPKINSVEDIARHIDFLNKSAFHNHIPNTNNSVNKRNLSSNSVEKNLLDASNCNVSINRVLEPKDTNTSRWVQYIDNDPVEECSGSSIIQEYSIIKSQEIENTNMFSLCDDDEIDNILII